MGGVRGGGVFFFYEKVVSWREKKTKTIWLPKCPAFQAASFRKNSEPLMK
jgi:hypothetical protein